eukprot:scaffold108347_cov53-Phaeocystis_antarctica.AAC.2
MTVPRGALPQVRGRACRRRRVCAGRGPCGRGRRGVRWVSHCQEAVLCLVAVPRPHAAILRRDRLLGPEPPEVLDTLQPQRLAHGVDAACLAHVRAHARAIADRGGGAAEQVRPPAVQPAGGGGPDGVDGDQVIGVLEVSECAVHCGLLLGRLRREADTATQRMQREGPREHGRLLGDVELLLSVGQVDAAERCHL